MTTHTGNHVKNADLTVVGGQGRRSLPQRVLLRECEHGGNAGRLSSIGAKIQNGSTRPQICPLCQQELLCDIELLRFLDSTVIDHEVSSLTTGFLTSCFFVNLRFRFERLLRLKSGSSSSIGHMVFIFFFEFFI
jgi:hypothetical protein